MTDLVVFDFETSGMDPAEGARPIEVGAVLLIQGQVGATFQRLMDPGFSISPIITAITGINNSMLASAKPVAQVMLEFYDFCADYPLVAHNASFDRAFLDSELQGLGKKRKNEIHCSLLTARRILSEASGFSLSRLARQFQLTASGPFHRALTDAEVTAQLWLLLMERLRQNIGLQEISLSLIATINTMKIAQARSHLAQLAQREKQGWLFQK